MNHQSSNLRILPAAGHTLAAGPTFATHTLLPAIAGQTCFKALSSLIGAFVVALSLALSSPAQDTFTNGLVAYYPFAGTASDAWGGLDGTVFGTLIPSADRFGQPGQALHFDGATWVDVANSPEIQLDVMTFSVWVQLDHTNVIMNLLNKDDFYAGYQLFVWDGKVIFSVGDGSWHSTEGNGHVTAGQWHHVTASYDGQAIRVYINGINTDSVDYAGGVAYGNRALQIGHNGWSGGQYVVGNLSDLRLYGRALSPDEIQQLYSYEASRLPQLALFTSPNTITLSFSRLIVGANYQLQLSGDLNTWTNHDPAFSATNSSIVYPQSFLIDKSPQRFFRLVQP